MATVHVGANADPHRASFWLAPPEGWLVPAEGRRASTTPYVLTHRAGRLRVAVTPIRDRTTVRSAGAPGGSRPSVSAECPVGARLASRRRVQIIRSVAAPERRVEDRRCRRLQRGHSARRHRRTAARRPLGGANTLGRRGDPGDRSAHGIVAAVCEPLSRSTPPGISARLGTIICWVVSYGPDFAHAGLRQAPSWPANLHRPPWKWPLCRPRRRCAPSQVGVLQLGRRRPHESPWMSSYGRYGGASPTPSWHRGVPMTSASGRELLSAIRVPHSR